MLSTFDRYQRIAPVYDLLDLPFEYGRYRRIRRLLFQGLSGRLLDAGVGTGRNFPFYYRSAPIAVHINPHQPVVGPNRPGLCDTLED